MRPIDLVGGWLGFVALGVLLVFVLAVYTAVIRWLWRQRGRGFAEGWFKVVDARDKERWGMDILPIAKPGAEKGAVGVPPTAPGPESPPPAPTERPQYTITGRRIR